jgi:ankyrin repeat protein
MKRKFLYRKPKETNIRGLHDAGDDYKLGYAKTLKRLLPHILRKELIWTEVDLQDNGQIEKCGEPVLFYVASSGIKTLEFLKSKKVNFYQKNSDGYTLLHQFSHYDEYDTDVFYWVLEWFKEHGYVDATTNDGFSALSCAIKFGAVNKAKKLLEAGANPMSQAKSAYLNAQGLTPWTQAINCLDGEEKRIACLNLLLSKSKPTPELITEMLESARFLNYSEIAKWIEKNLL